MKLNKLLFAAIMVSTMNVSSAQITFQKTFGGTAAEEGHCVQQTTDHGYILTGFTTSIGAGNHDVYLIKTDESGDTLWTKTYGGIDYDYGFSVRQTTDGGYILAGRSNQATGFYAAYLIKTDHSGDTLWTRIFGGYTPNSASGFSVQQTVDGGYIFAGDITIDGDVGLTKTDSSGNTLWTKSYGGASSYDIGYSVQQTTDSGYIITGFTNSFGAGYYDVYLIKTDNLGNMSWSKTYGGTSADIGWSVQQTSDEGYIITGGVTTSGVSGADLFLLKINSSGDTLWTKTYGETGGEIGYCVQQTSDGGYIISGASRSGISNPDVLLMKTDSIGNWSWSRTFGGIGYDEGWYVQQTNDSGYIITGYTSSFGAGGSDFYLIKTDANGNSGCNEGNLTNNPDTFSITVGTPATIVASGGTTAAISSVVSSGGAVTNTTLCTTVGINEITADYSLFIYPNPFTNELSIKGTMQNGVIILFNLTGKEILRQISSAVDTKINTEAFLPGFYLLNYCYGNKITNMKLVKFQL